MRKTKKKQTKTVNGSTQVEKIQSKKKLKKK